MGFQRDTSIGGVFLAVVAGCDGGSNTLARYCRLVAGQSKSQAGKLVIRRCVGMGVLVLVGGSTYLAVLSHSRVHLVGHPSIR